MSGQSSQRIRKGVCKYDSLTNTLYIAETERELEDIPGKCVPLSRETLRNLEPYIQDQENLGHKIVVRIPNQTLRLF